MSKKEKFKDAESQILGATASFMLDEPEAAPVAEPPSAQEAAPVVPEVAPQEAPSKTVTNKSRKRYIVNTNTRRVLTVSHGETVSLLPGEEDSPEIVNNINLQVK